MSNYTPLEWSAISALCRMKVDDALRYAEVSSGSEMIDRRDACVPICKKRINLPRKDTDSACYMNQMRKYFAELYEVLSTRYKIHVDKHSMHDILYFAMGKLGYVIIPKKYDLDSTHMNYIVLKDMFNMIRHSSFISTKSGDHLIMVKLIKCFKD